MGELVALNSTCVHSVRTVTRGERITFATFVGYRGRGKPWSFWS
jgi:predicted 2-oxoglutarate/Fe(II)-dependent dioxygenase YbiX